MGKINSNNIVSSFSGKLGDELVFRQIGNRTFFSKKGINTKAPSAAQNENRQQFAEAQYYAYKVLQDPTQSEWYSIVAKINGLRNAQLAVIKDYRTKPEIETLDTKSYKGNIGDVIHIKPKMLLKIEKIEITIYAPDGSILESGLAVKTELKWKYHATVFNADVEGSRVVAVTYDRLGKSCRVVSYLTLIS
jgi:hypothetical protein